MKKFSIGLFLLISILSIQSCKKKTGCTNKAAENYDPEAIIDDGSCVCLAIGQQYQGGILAYFLKQGDPGFDQNVRHGLIAAPYDQSTGIQWYNGSFIATGTTEIAIGSGNTNTNTIVNIQGQGNYAAKLCYDLVIGGYDDWCLPSINELARMFTNRIAIGGFNPLYYWSSSEYDLNKAWIYNFHPDAGYSSCDYKIFQSYCVRAIRAF